MNKTPCCQYQILEHDTGPIYWNQFNKVVQCHACGTIFSEARVEACGRPPEDILEEALRITSGDRQAEYGPPEQDFARTADMWNALFGDKLQARFRPRDVAMAMICLKLSRETHQCKRDSAVDIAGYARCLHLCNEADKHEPNGSYRGSYKIVRPDDSLAGVGPFTGRTTDDEITAHDDVVTRNDNPK